MKEYPLVNFPYNLRTIDRTILTDDNLKNYYQWFVGIRLERLGVLNKVVFNREEINFDKKELTALQYFLQDSITTNEKTEDIIKKEYNQLPKKLRKAHKIKPYQFVEPTYSIAFDVSIYFGELILMNIKKTEWNLETNPKMAQFGYPCIKKPSLKRVKLVPYWIVMTLVTQIFEKRATEERLFELYQTWENSFNGIKEDYSWLFD